MESGNILNQPRIPAGEWVHIETMHDEYVGRLWQDGPANPAFFAGVSLGNPWTPIEGWFGVYGYQWARVIDEPGAQKLAAHAAKELVGHRLVPED